MLLLSLMCYRVRQLFEGWHFLCGCLRCSDPAEAGANTNTMVSQKLKAETNTMASQKSSCRPLQEIIAIENHKQVNYSSRCVNPAKLHPSYQPLQGSGTYLGLAPPVQMFR